MDTADEYDFKEFHSPNKSAVVFENKRLSFIAQDSWQIPSILFHYAPRAQILDLSFNCLVTLKGLEKFCQLQELILDNNCLNDSLILPRLSELHALSLNKNNVTNLELLLTKIENNLPCLHYLSLLGNVACPNQLSDKEKDDDDYQRYRYYVIYRLPKLKFLDSSRVTSEEKQEALRRGKFMKIISPLSKKEILQDNDSPYGNLVSSYTPLPKSKRDLGDHQGAYGKCRYRYSGKNSEGNRFIYNSDL